MSRRSARRATIYRALAQLYASSRLYINFFQPSFKLKTKTREGAHVSKTYHPPATPCSQLLASTFVSEEVKAKLRVQFNGLDPVRLLQDIRAAQQMLSDMVAHGPQDIGTSTPAVPEVSAFLEGLATAWKNGEVRPTHRKSSTAQRWWRTREDPFELAWPVVEGWLITEPAATAKELMDRLARAAPDAYASKAQLRTLQRRIKAWRAEKAKDLVLASWAKWSARRLRFEVKPARRNSGAEGRALRARQAVDMWTMRLRRTGRDRGQRGAGAPGVAHRRALRPHAHSLRPREITNPMSTTTKRR